ncbi:hypothetical protein CFOL_v3_12049 [Cephalotus follicularis]|uniref:Zf-RVT domain-containing protein n=1 Tax=Cephalotus follicularis TaxID=3775 RepID=A0A1Q3BKI6_CEPFO|nr:hypothetical protein CFOL_v3_12049 [Cephalotus follicularis]
MPVHIMSLLKIPKMVSKRVQSLFANFLWSSQGNSRHRWISWHQICHPFEEGGLGIRNMDSVMQALQSKLAWLFLQGESLWAQIVRSKYGTCHHILQNGIRPFSSHCWKAIAKHLPFISNNSRMIIRSGNSSFWKENWLGCPLWFPACPLPALTVKEALDIPLFWTCYSITPKKRWPSPSSSSRDRINSSSLLCPPASSAPLSSMKKSATKPMPFLGLSISGIPLSPPELPSSYGRLFLTVFPWIKTFKEEAFPWSQNVGAALIPRLKLWSTSFFKEMWLSTSGDTSAKLLISPGAGICPLYMLIGLTKSTYPVSSAWSPLP